MRLAWIISSVAAVAIAIIMVQQRQFLAEIVGDVAELYEKRKLFWHVATEEELVPGDHLYSKRYFGLYVHHGIYEGNNSVIHFSGTLPADARIKRCSLREFSGWQAFRIRVAYYGLPRHLMWLKIPGTAYAEQSSPGDIVVERARKLLNESESIRFSIHGKNCEGLAYYCKTGLSWQSIQAMSIPEFGDILRPDRFLRKAVYWISKVVSTLAELLLLLKYEFGGPGQGGKAEVR